MDLRKTIRRILREELNNDLTEFQRQEILIRKLLDGASFEGVCGFTFSKVTDRYLNADNNRLGRIMIKFSEEWYRTDNDSKYLNKKLQLMQETKKQVEDIIERYLNLDNIHIGSYLEKCN